MHRYDRCEPLKAFAAVPYQLVMDSIRAAVWREGDTRKSKQHSHKRCESLKASAAVPRQLMRRMERGRHPARASKRDTRRQPWSDLSGEDMVSAEGVRSNRPGRHPTSVLHARPSSSRGVRAELKLETVRRRARRAWRFAWKLYLQKNSHLPTFNVLCPLSIVWLDQ